MFFKGLHTVSRTKSSNRCWCKKKTDFICISILQLSIFCPVLLCVFRLYICRKLQMCWCIYMWTFSAYILKFTHHNTSPTHTVQYIHVVILSHSHGNPLHQLWEFTREAVRFFFFKCHPWNHHCIALSQANLLAFHNWRHSATSFTLRSKRTNSLLQSVIHYYWGTTHQSRNMLLEPFQKISATSM